MANATEIVFLPLKEGVSYSDPNVKEFLSTILQQDGSQRLFMGPQVEHPAISNMFIDWASIDHHKKFMASEGYEGFLAKAGESLSGPPSLYHALLEPFPPSGAFSEVTEFITVYFPTTYSAEDQKKFHADMIKFGGIVDKAWEGCRGSAGGWVAEELDLPGGSEKGKAYVMLIGWTSVDSHMKYRETQSFKDNIHLLRGAKDLKNLAVFHVAASEFKP